MAMSNWSHEELVAEARVRGVAGAETMSRAELLRALLKRRSDPIESARAFFGRVFERVREVIPSSAPPSHQASRGDPEPEPEPDEESADEPILTRTMAGLLASQGQGERALAIYEQLMRAHPADDALRGEAERLRARLSDRGEVPSQDELTALPAKRGRLLLAWAISSAAIDRARVLLGANGTLALRLILVEAGAGGQISTSERERVGVPPQGEWVFEGLSEGMHFTASIGLREGERFVSIAHSPSGRMRG